MTQNKYHVVIIEPKFTFNTLEEAEKIAKGLAQKTEKREIAVAVGLKSYKIVTNLIETDLSAPEESLAVEPKFKVGDRVRIKDGIVPLMKNIVDIWEIYELLPLKRVSLNSEFYKIIVFFK